MAAGRRGGRKKDGSVWVTAGDRATALPLGLDQQGIGPANPRVLLFGISARGKLQGLMKLESVGRSGRTASQKGKPLTYVDYLETAPWNIKPLMQALGRSPEFAVVGTRLIEAAVRKSLDEGFKGRLALHSLSTSERFYLDVCGMTAVGRDPAKQNLLWCEFTPEQAERFLQEGAA